MEPFFPVNTYHHRQVPCNCRKRSFLIRISFYYTTGLLLLLWSNVTCGITPVEADDSTLQDSSAHIMEYLLNLKRSQDEIFRKIDWLTKAVETKDHEGDQFRLKFSRKVHTLESKVLYMEQTFTQKVEEVVQRKVNEMMMAASSSDNRARYHHHDRYYGISGSSSSNSPRNSHGSSVSSSSANGDDGSTDAASTVNVQNHQPSSSSLYNSINIHPPPSSYHRYQPHYQFNQHHHPPFNYNNNQASSNNWGFYEHPITRKRVRESQTNLFGYEPPTRDLPLISLVATTTTTAAASGVTTASQQQQQISRTVTTHSDVLKGRSSSPSSFSNRGTTMTAEGTTRMMMKGERDAVEIVPSSSSSQIQEFQKKFESYDMTLKLLRDNVTNLEKEMFKAMTYQNKEYDNSEIHRLLVETRKDVTGLHQNHQEMVHRIEHFTVEMEKVAAKREHAVNESLKEISSDVKKQITRVKAYTKKQIQNITATSGVAGGNSQTPDKLKCAQTLLDELLAQLSKPNAHPSQMVRYDTIADQAGSEEEMGNERTLFHMSRRSADKDKQGTILLVKELETQRNDILALKSDIGRLNVSQILLMRTLDEETLKRTVRPRDCTEIRLLRNGTSGIYSIFPKMNDVSTEVYCDMETDGGGWTIIQRRGTPISPEVNDGRRESFNRNWGDYEKGFGTLQGDFWLGLSNIALLCQIGIQELRIDLTNWSGETRFATYQYFKVSNGSQFYRINVKEYSGTAGDSLSRHNGMSFSTPDQDRDADPRRHCAKTYFSGWWYYACFESNLNGLYIGDQDNNYTHAFGTGIIWHHWMNNDYSLKNAEMKIRNRFI